MYLCTVKVCNTKSVLTIPAKFVAYSLLSFDCANSNRPVTGESALERSLSMYDVANQAFDSMQGSIARQKLAAYPPDFLIEIPRNACGILEFHKAERVIELGYAKAREFLQQNQHKF